MEDYKIKVFIKVDKNNIVRDINSSIFLNNTENYICIDEGFGDKYSHAQNYYLERPLTDLKNRYNYKYIDNKITELTEEEKELLFPLEQPKATEQQVLNAKLLQDNANMQIELGEQKKLNAQMLLQIASLGGNTNV